MKIELLQLLRCPQSGQRLVLEGCNVESVIESGWLISEDGRYRYPIHNSIPRFVPEDNYANSFGIQWNLFSRTQLDSYSGHPISANRFWTATRWSAGELKGRWVLDVGCGAGRFAEVALNAGAKVVALDYSRAVDACYENLQGHPDLHVVQGDVYALPFARESFAFVYCLGVLQHTPNVAMAFAALPSMVNDGGKLCVDFYAKTWKSVMLPKYWLRPVTKRLPKPILFSLLKRLVPVLLPLSRLIGNVPIVGKGLRRLVPVANYYGIYPLNDQQQFEWSLLDTFDWLSPRYDNPQTTASVKSWMEEAEVAEIEVVKAGHLVGRGRITR